MQHLFPRGPVYSRPNWGQGRANIKNYSNLEETWNSIEWMHRYKADKAAALHNQLGKKSENYKKLQHYFIHHEKSWKKGVPPSKTKVIEKRSDFSLPNWLQLAIYKNLCICLGL